MKLSLKNITPLRYYLIITGLTILFTLILQFLRIIQYVPFIYALLTIIVFPLWYLKLYYDLSAHLKVYHPSLFWRLKDRLRRIKFYERLSIFFLLSADLKDSKDKKIQQYLKQSKEALFMIILSILSQPIITNFVDDLYKLYDHKDIVKEATIKMLHSHGF